MISVSIKLSALYYLTRAGIIAGELGHKKVETGHILLSFLADTEVRAIWMIQGNVEEKARATLGSEQTVPSGEFLSFDLPYSPEACKVLTWAEEVRQNCEDLRVSRYHLFLALLSIEGCNAFKALSSEGYTLEKVQDLFQAIGAITLPTAR